MALKQEKKFHTGEIYFLSVVFQKIQFFWDVMLYCWVNSSDVSNVYKTIFRVKQSKKNRSESN